MRYELRSWLPWAVVAGAAVGAAGLSGAASWLWRRRRRLGQRRAAPLVASPSQALVPHEGALVAYDEAPLPAIRPTSGTGGTQGRRRPGRHAGWSSALFVVFVVALAAAAWTYRDRHIEREVNAATGGVAARAIPVMLANGCGGCHTISGVPGAEGKVGPRLDATLSSKSYLAGVLPNTWENMVRWLRFAREIEPHTAMPSTGISEQQARDVAAYLYALR
jgi:mono/diheme cytochrome c family protein